MLKSQTPRQACGLDHNHYPSEFAGGDASLTIDCPSGAIGRLCECAVPLPQGRLRDLRAVTLKTPAGAVVECDIRESLRWPDGSFKWIHLLWLAVDSDSLQCCIAPTASQQLASEDAKQVCRAVQECPKRNPGNGLIQVEGVIADLAIKLEDGTVLTPKLGQHQLVRDATIAKPRSLHGHCCDASGRVLLNWSAFVQSIPAIGMQRWSLTIWNPRAARHPGGIWELGDPNSCLLASVGVGVALSEVTEDATAAQSGPTPEALGRLHARAEASARWYECQRTWRLNQLGSGGEHYRSPIHRDRSGAVPVTQPGYRLVDDTGEHIGNRASPSLIYEGSHDAALGIYVPKFWQHFPRGLAWDGEQLLLEVFPELQGRMHELQPGEQCTVEFWLATGTAQQVKQRLDAHLDLSPPRIDPAWIARTGVVPWLTPRDDSPHSDEAAYLALVDQAVQGPNTFLDKRERIDQYGWRHFGDIYGDHEAVHSDPDNPLVSHYNNQYDVVLGLGIQYLRSGDPRWRELMSDLARHVIDIDIYHTDEDWPAYNHGMFWHTVHYVDAGLATHRSYPQGTCGGGPNSGHAYARGLLLYFCLTGDETAREAVVQMGNWMIDAEDGRRSKYRWFAGGETGLTSASGTETYHGPGRGPGNAVDVLLVAFELTQERRYLDQAEHLIRRVVHPHEDIAALDLLDAENKWFYLMFLQALGQYLELKISMNEIDNMYAYGQTVLLRYAQWMAEYERPFLQCPDQLDHPTETWAAQDMRKVEVFQWAARHASGSQREQFLERARWFFDHATQELGRFETKHFCRPVALLLSNGHSHRFFRNGGLDQIPPPAPAPAVDFPPQRKFVSQKSRAVQNIKRLAASGAVATAAGVAGLVFWWFNR